MPRTVPPAEVDASDAGLGVPPVTTLSSMDYRVPISSHQTGGTQVTAQDQAGTGTSRQWDYTGTRGPLAARAWAAGPASPTHVVVLSHGYGEHAGRYEHVARALVDNGAVVYAGDHQGHGNSSGEKVLVHDFEEVVSDLHILDETARQENPGLPVVLVGHSMGGLIAARYAQRYGSSLAALVLSGPVLGSWATLSALLALDEIPDVPLDISTLSRDPAVGAAYSADPLVWHGPFKRPTLEALQRAVDTVAAGPDLGDLPTLWVHGEADELVPIDATRVGMENLSGSRTVERTYPEARHEVFN